MLNQPLVSIIIPTYNRENTILKSLESVLNQTYKNIEVIVVDDNSRDNTESVITKFNNSKVRYIKNKSNLGPSGARNVGINVAKGSYIAFQDSDDEWLPEKLEKQMKLFQTDDYGLVYCACRFIKNNITFQHPSNKYSRDELEGFIYRSLFKGNKMGTVTMVIKKDVLQEVGGFSEELKCYVDWDLALRICHKYKVGYVNEMLINVNYTLDSVVNNRRNGLDAYISILNSNIAFVEDKSDLCEMIAAILRLMILELNSEEFIIYRNKIVPSIMDETMFTILMHETKRSVKFKTNYELAMLMHEIENIETKLNDYLASLGIKTIAIYGSGRVGYQLIKIIKKTNIKIEFIIDENKSYINELNVLGINELNKCDINKNDAIIVTTPYDFNQIFQKIESIAECKVLNLEYILSHELV